MNIDPSDMHHALAFASLYIGDTQTMAAEAAVLGTPSIRLMILLVNLVTWKSLNISMV